MWPTDVIHSCKHIHQFLHIDINTNDNIQIWVLASSFPPLPLKKQVSNHPSFKARIVPPVRRHLTICCSASERRPKEEIERTRWITRSTLPTCCLKGKKQTCQAQRLTAFPGIYVYRMEYLIVYYLYTKYSIIGILWKNSYWHVGVDINHWSAFVQFPFRDISNPYSIYSGIIIHTWICNWIQTVILGVVECETILFGAPWKTTAGMVS